MINRLIELSLRNRFIVIALSIAFGKSLRSTSLAGLDYDVTAC